MSDVIKAERNGMVREFTRKQWDIIGTDKHGWVEIAQAPPVPKEVAHAVERFTAQPTQTTTITKRKGRK